MSKQRCEQLAKRLGAEIHDWDEIRLEAPSGKTFNGDVHEQIYNYEQGDKAGAWKDLLQDLRYFNRMGGFPVCQKKFDFEECEWCDDQTAKVGA